MKELQKKLTEMTEPRRVSYGNIRHKLDDIIIIGLCTVICGGEDYNDMEAFGREREEWLRGFLELPNGIPDSDTFRRLFERLNPAELSACLYDWLDLAQEERCVVAVDGKTIRGSGNAAHKAYHVVSAFVAENQITLGEVVVEEKRNEISAIPALLDLIDVTGDIVTADAMGCQKEIVQKISEKNSDYVIGLKENQKTLYRDAALYFSTFKNELPSYETVGKDHGRIETRTYYLLTEHAWEYDWENWTNLNGIGMVHSKTHENNTVREDTRYFITSLTDVQEFADAVRKHWSIENQLHWNLDVIFREDVARARKDNSPLNMNVLRKTALSLVEKAKYGRVSKKKMMFKAALNPQVLLDILFHKK